MVTMAVSTLTTPVLAAALGDELHMAGTEIADGTSLAKGVYWNTAYSDKLAENYIEYTPSYSVTPIVEYGGSILSGGSFASLANKLESQGMHVIGGINGDYFTMSNYEPLGLVMAGGAIKSSSGNYPAIGFRGNGTAVIGNPGMSISVETEAGSFPVSTYNKTRISSEFALFDGEFSSTTRNTISGTDIVLIPPDAAALTANCTLEMTVESVQESSGAFAIPAGRFVLSLSENADEWRQSGIEALAEGDKVTISVTMANPDWHEVDYAVGCYKKLVTNGSLESGLDNTSNPRTAVGVKADGTVVLYTIDGRQTGISAGASMTQVAQRLIELGCTEAGLLDGGGSTSLNALYIGNESLSQINSPSDGSARTVTNYIMLVTTAGPTGNVARLGVSPYDTLMLSGASRTFGVKAADSSGYPVAVPTLTYSLTENLGTVSGDGVFTAGAVSGDETLVVSGGGAEGFATIKVVDTPHVITVYNESSWKTVSSLSMVRGETINLYAAASYNRMSLTVSDGCYTWEVSGDIGSIDSEGRFTANPNADADGEIRVTAGEKTVMIPVTVGWDNPFSDVKSGDWFYDSVKQCHDSGLMTGISESVFGHGEEMTRAMLVTLLYRLEDPDSNAGGSDVKFSDVPNGEWYSDAVAWAAENGLVSGYEDGKFRPMDKLTREQLCTLILRYASFAGVELPKIKDEMSFADADSISDYAKDGVKSCQLAGLVNGRGDNKFEPRGGATRAELAVMIQRFLGLL